MGVKLPGADTGKDENSNRLPSTQKELHVFDNS